MNKRIAKLFEGMQIVTKWEDSEIVKYNLAYPTDDCIRASYTIYKTKDTILCCEYGKRFQKRIHDLLEVLDNLPKMGERR